MNLLPPRHRRPSISSIIKSGLILLWFVLFGMLLQRDFFVRTIDPREAVALERAEKTEFQSIYLKDEKIGYVENQFLPEPDERLRIRQNAVMQLNISGQLHPVSLELDGLLGAQNNLLSFAFSFSSPFYQMSATGTVDGSVVSFTLDTGNNTINDSITLQGPPMLATSRRGYLLSQTLQEGEKVKIPWFDPLSLTGKESVIEYRGKEKILINERVYNLHRFTELFSGVRVNSWLDEDGNVVKEESPAGFVFIREPEFRAKDLDSAAGTSDLLASVSVKVTGEMFDLANRTEARYRLTLPEEPVFELNSGRQRFAGHILSLTREDLAQVAASNPQACNDAREELLATTYIQSAAPEIVARSMSITEAAEDDLDKVRRLADWVYQSLEKRPVIGIPDALTTLQAGIGDCNEHASLFAALARAAGIPTKIAVGVVYHREAFYYHAWNEVCLNDTWVSLDTTTNQLPADLSHLKFVEGELQEQIKIGALLNTLEIEPLHD
jgi:transglutaminase-like putative cysteine protease